ncbi:MAG: alpha-glucosidase [Acholeplasmataceae bacterium]|nr:alpha-glucosidase [Acholeplasmataceae bacterium]
MDKKWWMESVGYQIYVKSFKDGNDDGIGDLLGIHDKLSYLSDLGVNLLWIGPFYDSPMDDNGYDVRDFFKVNPTYGTLDDVKRIIHDAHQLGIRVIFDFVLNHTSDEHPWFVASRSSEDDPKRHYYIWQKGRMTKDGLIEPTNWASFFGGSCWTRNPGTDDYYMHIFSKKMPDLNWANPLVRKEMAKVGAWWLDLGVDGFRIDAVSHLDRAPFEDIETTSRGPVLDWHRFSNLPAVHPYLKEMNERLFKPYGCLTIGEVGGEASIEEGLKYAAFDAEELSMVFNFDHNWCNNLHESDDPDALITDVHCLRRTFMAWQKAFASNGWLPLNWLNHDQPRLLSHYGSEAYPKRSAKMLATMLHMMRGTPFIYQGEEIGMKNYPFTKADEFRDIASIQQLKTLERDMPDVNQEDLVRIVAKTSRDHPRTPMQWSDEPNAGFSGQTPWINVHPDYQSVNVRQEQLDHRSILAHYKQLISLRLSSRYQDVIKDGEIRFLDLDDPDLMTYLRIGDSITLLVINNMHDIEKTYDLSPYDTLRVVITNHDTPIIKDHVLTLKPFESMVFEVKEHL